ncbi:Sterile alpha motif domain-containing protein 9-like [Triplophysa tibetana]|uniref:Sterile alpha motif domain-containing protein 9-like n=1 Tax=Triplophysa tibetana TaxID=1572043 RepID=A0A5A9N949_9TELE|nr:Sterile alpha motif domain-containing protein 9-like [Triplophysa tibetana]
MDTFLTGFISDTDDKQSLHTDNEMEMSTEEISLTDYDILPPRKWSTEIIYDVPNALIRKKSEQIVECHSSSVRPESGGLLDDMIASMGTESAAWLYNIAHTLFLLDYKSIPCSNWNENHVSSWLQTIGLKPEYIEKLEKEVTGPVLLTIEKSYLREIGLQGGQIQLLLHRRDELLQQDKSKLQQNTSYLCKGREDAEPKADPCNSVTKLEETLSVNDEFATHVFLTPSGYRKFDDNDAYFSYKKNAILPPETGIHKMITPCHEYKSLENACKLESRKLKVKFASEVIRFACACMNMRANGTIHFGIMDKTKTSYKHGEIIGIPIKDREDYEDALDYIEHCFPTQNSDARKCIKPPKFIPVIDKDDQTQSWIVEVDVVPMVNIVRGKLYSARIPKFNEKTNKVEYEQKAYYHRVGPNTPRIKDDELVHFVHAEVHFKEDLGRKLCVLLTRGKKCMDNTLHYIIVSNRFDQENLQNIKFLAHMNIFSVFDFDPDSKLLGFCHNYQEHHAVNLHFLHDYDHRENITDFIKKLQLYERTSWIFCNGRNNYNGDERSFVVLFILNSEVEQPLVDTFHEFYAEMSGHEDIVIISESMENYKKWACLAQVFCSLDALEQNSVVGIPMSHIDATIQRIQLTSRRRERRLPVSNKGVCFLKPVDEDYMLSLEVVCVDQCDETNEDIMEQEQINKIEQYFYQGGKIDWMNLWLADRNQCGEVIKRDAYEDINKILEDLVLSNTSKRSIENINIYHHPGSGGSTVARQILWNWRKKIRCAMVKLSYQPTTVCEHAVMLQNYQEVDSNSCLPVLLLLEDCNTEYQDDLRRELSNAVTSLKISSSTLCFIILCCKRSLDPENMCKAWPLRTVAVTHKLSSEEKKLFSKKAENLKPKFEPEFILTFVLMSKEFQPSYITGCVGNLLKGIEHSCSQTQLIKFVALLNSHIQNSYLSISHCEAFLRIGIQLEQVRHHAFENYLSEQARFFFIQLKSSETHIDSFRIIHHLVAKEILKQLSSQQPQSAIAMDLLQNKVLFDHRFDQEEFKKFVRDLFIKRTKKSKGDPNDSWFSPLIEHVWKTESLEKAIGLLKVAYERFKEDAFVAQQLARLLNENKRSSENCPESQKVCLNNSYFGEVDIGCRLLELLSNVDVFATKMGKFKLVDYLLTDYTPEEVQKPWHKFHGLLKGINNSIRIALECICEDLARFQNHSSEEEEELDEGEPEKINNPRKWLLRKSAVYAKIFSVDIQKDEAVDNKRQRAGEKLEKIISLFPADLKDLDKTVLINAIFCQIALSCASPSSDKLFSIQKLQDVARHFGRERRIPLPATAYFLLSLLFWPEDLTIREDSTTRSDIVTNAIGRLHRYHEINPTAVRKGRILTHFFLGKASGLNKIVHKTTIEKFIKGTFNERRLKWQGGEVWTNPEVVRLLKRVDGYTENGNLFIKLSKNNIRVIPLFSASLPSSNENMTFYLGFSFHGVVAFDIKVSQ